MGGKREEKNEKKKLGFGGKRGRGDRGNFEKRVKGEKKTQLLGGERDRLLFRRGKENIDVR